MPVAGAPGTAAASATGRTVSCRPSRPTVGISPRLLVSWLDTSAGSTPGVSCRCRAALQAPLELKDQRNPPEPAWTWPLVVPQPAEASAPVTHPSALASAGTGTQAAPPACTARPDSDMLP